MRKSTILLFTIILSCKSSINVDLASSQDIIWATGLITCESDGYNIMIDQVYLNRGYLKSYDSFKWMPDSTKEINKFGAIQNYTMSLKSYFRCSKLIMNEILFYQSDSSYVNYLTKCNVSDRVLLIGSPVQDQPKIFEATYIEPLIKNTQRELLKNYWPLIPYTLEVYSKYR